MKTIILLTIIISLKLNAQQKEDINYSLNCYFSIKPNGYYLCEAVTNPYSPTLKYYFCVADTSETEIVIFDLEDESKIVLFGKHNLSPGFYELIWYGKNRYNEHLVSGIYILKITANSLERKNLNSCYVGKTKIVFLR